ncbi:MAG: hypothetical protein K2G19_04210 [Lachnospiraceae bacterium]|nr:hypothetical protein [Lachnospiraceae bacterium]
MKEFNDNLDMVRKNMQSDKKLFELYPSHYNNIEQIKDLSNGCFSFGEGQEEKYKCLLQKKDSDYLYVLFNGAIGKSIKRRKYFNRWSWANLIDANVLNILDPMYFLYHNLPIGWYWGTSDIDFRQEMAILIKKTASALQIPFSNIVLYGSSAGGTAAIYTAHYIPGCTAVALNPQVRPWKHEWHEEFKEIVKIDTEKYDKFHRNNFYWHLDNSGDCKYVILANCRSRRDFNWQLVPIAQHYDFALEYGLTKYKNLYLWIFDTGEMGRHSALEYQAVFVAIDNFVRSLKDSVSVRQLNSYVKLINEFWRDHWELVFQNEKQANDINERNCRLQK